MGTALQSLEISDDRGGLDALFAPRSVAIVGASSDARRFGGKPIQYLLQAGFDGSIYPVNPARDEIQGLRAYPSVSAIDGPVDCAILAVSAEATGEALDQCIARGVRAAILYGAGFSEAGETGAALQAELARKARAGGVRLLGPNCMGVMDAHARFYGTFASALEEGVPAPGRIGVASQSGGYGGYLMKHLFMRGLGLSQWITTGNESDVDLGEALGWMAARPETEILLGYLEGLRNKDSLVEALALAQRLKKPVVMMKVGRTAEGAAAAASHTAALTGEDKVYDALFARYGVHRARTTEELLDVAYALSKGRLPAGPRVGVVSISGGVGVQAADYVSDAGLVMGRTPDETQAALRALVPHCAPANPIDMTGLVSTNHQIMGQTLDAVLASRAFDAVLVFLGIAGAAPSMARPLQEAISQAYARHPDALLMMAVTAPAESVREYDEAGLLTFEDPARAVAALAALHRFRRSFDAPIEPEPPAGEAVDLPSRDLNEAEAKALLARCGVPSPRERLVATPAEAAEAARAIGGPVAVKVVSADMPHKSEYGGVALNLDPDGAAEAVARMVRDIPARLPHARIDGYLVSEMVSGGVECIVGVHADPVFGPVVTFGLGGVLVELLRDTTCRLAPVSEAEARAMIGEVRASPLLTGYRGGPAHDVDALARAISALSRLAAANTGRIAAIEVNPLVVRPGRGGVVALDAVVQVRRP